MTRKIKLYTLKILSKIRCAFLGKYAVSVTYSTKNGLISIPVEDFQIGRKLGFQGKWDWDEVDFLSDLITENDTVYIIGTHVGTLLIPLSKKAKEVVGFDANPKIFKFLQNNIYLNNIKNYKIFNYAVGNKYGSLKFLQSKVNSGGSKIMPEIENYLFTYDNPSVIEVEIVPLDDFIEKNNLTYGEILIMDIEGSEYFALQGMPKSLEKCKYLYIEFEPNHLKFVSNCDTDTFFDVFIDQFKEVKFMRSHITINLIENKSVFSELIKKMYNRNDSDDLLFSK